MVKKSFIAGILSGVFCSVLVFTVISYEGKKRNKGSSESVIVQNSIIKNITDTMSCLTFADDCLREYSDGLLQIRSLVINATDKQKMVADIHTEINKLNDILEKAEFNCIPVFYSKDGEPVRRIPVTVVADKPTLKLQVTCKDFNREILTKYQKELQRSVSANDGTATPVDEFDKIIDSVSLERARLGAYTDRLNYAKRVASITVTNTPSAEQEKSIRKVKEDIYNKLYSLCVQSANGIYNDFDRKTLQIEYDQLADELLTSGSKYDAKSEYGFSHTISLLSQSDAEKGMLDFAARY